MSRRHGSVSTQLQDWLAARSLATTIKTPLHTHLEEPIDPKNPNGRPQAEDLQLLRREPKPTSGAHNPSTATGVINFVIDAAEKLPVADFWLTLLAYPSDRVLRRAYLIRSTARTAVTLRVWIYIASLYGLGVPGAFSSWRGVSLAIAIVIALLPISALAALLRPISSALSFLAKNL
ncbi:hypothetical protein CcaverHIS641_0703260 [Cutaneotrichosporon cavernicola]|nr:hypothetical protein CcaverHIS641_0703260 [Cutaneotrichosporon cavernicola]